MANKMIAIVELNQIYSERNWKTECHDNQHNDNQHSGNQHYNNQHNDNQYNDTLYNGTQHNYSAPGRLSTIDLLIKVACFLENK